MSVHWLKDPQWDLQNNVLNEQDEKICFSFINNLLSLINRLAPYHFFLMLQSHLDLLKTLLRVFKDNTDRKQPGAGTLKQPAVSSR